MKLVCVVISFELRVVSHVREKVMSYYPYLQTSACEKVIRRDIARTYPEHKFFMEKDGQGQESLFNVMKVNNYGTHANKNNSGVIQLNCL